MVVALGEHDRLTAHGDEVVGVLAVVLSVDDLDLRLAHVLLQRRNGANGGVDRDATVADDPLGRGEEGRLPTLNVVVGDSS